MKKILVLNYFPVTYPPVTGGVIRYFHIYNQLSRYYDITLLSQSGARKTVVFSPTFREYRVPATPDHVQLPTVHDWRNVWLNYELGLVKNIVLANYRTLYSKYLDRLYESSDIIVHESSYLVGYDQNLCIDQKPRIYNSHNHDFLLAANTWKNQKTREYLPLLYKLEKKLTTRADLVFATSEQERDSFIGMYNLNPEKVKLAPNGIHPDEWLKRRDISRNSDGKAAKALFIGSYYPPNIEAANFIINYLAEKCPGVEFIIAGGCCKPFPKAAGTNVTLLGPVSHGQKLQLFATVDIAINPMFSGSGINIKVLEFLSAGIPLFSTKFGVRGLDLKKNEHYIQAEMKDFPVIINRFIQRKEMLIEISQKGRAFINNHYSWNAIAKNIKNNIDNLCGG